MSLIFNDTLLVTGKEYILFPAWIRNFYVTNIFSCLLWNVKCFCLAIKDNFLVLSIHVQFRILIDPTVYPQKYAHGFCFAVLCCGYTLTDFPISTRLTSLALWQSNDCPSASKATLMNMDKCFMWIHYERLHNHNKEKHNKTVCIFLGIYCSTIQLGYWKRHVIYISPTNASLAVFKVLSVATVGSEVQYTEFPAEPAKLIR